VTAPAWRAPEAADDNQPSVEVLDLPGGAVGLRTDDAREMHLVIPAAAWAEFVAAVKASQFDPPAPSVPSPRPAAAAQVEARSERRGCRHPRKLAFNLDDPAEAKLAQRHLGRGRELRRCSCGFHHVGPSRPGTAEHEPMRVLQPGEGGPLAWAQERRRVTLVNGQGQVHAVGEVLAYIDAPTVQVRLADGRVIPWRLDLTVPASD
jgi:hypothetical protein